MIKLFLKLLIILVFLNASFQETIIADPNFPILLTNPNVGNATKLDFRFQMPVRTYQRLFFNSNSTIPQSFSGPNPTAQGIGFNQFFGVRFPVGMFSFSSSSNIQCQLTGTTTTYQVTYFPSVQSNLTNAAANTNIVYCGITDIKNNMVPLVQEVLTLSIIFPTTLTVSNIYNIGIFTSTSNCEDQIIIDSIPIFGSVGIYSSFRAQNNNKLIEIFNGGGSSVATVTSPANQSTNKLFPGFTFDARITFQIAQYWTIDSSNYIVYVKFSTASFQAPTSLSSENFSTAKNEGALKTIPSFTVMSDGIILTGFNPTDLFPQRKFILVLSGMKATLNNLGIGTLIETYVYYKNTLTIISYSSLNMDVVSIVTFTSTINHPENFWLYDGMAFPFLFTITSPVDLEGGYIVIRQTGYSNTLSSVVFIPATLDLSATNYDSTFANRYNAYPLRNNFNYDITSGVSSTDLEGNGFYFRVNNIINSLAIPIKIWAFIEKCYSSTNGAAFNFGLQLTFSIRLFKYNAGFKGNNTLANELVFFTPTSSTPYNNTWVIGQSLNVVMSQYCFPLQTRSEKMTQTYTDAAPYGTDPYYDPASIPKNRSTLPIGIEITNLRILKVQTESNLANFAYTPFFTPLLTAASYNSLYTEMFLFSTSPNLSSSNLFFVGIFRTKALFRWSTSFVVGATTYYNPIGWSPQDYFPTECISAVAGTAGYVTALNTYNIVWLFGSDFLTQTSSASSSTSSGCQLSWQMISNENAATNNALSTLFFSATSTLAGSSWLTSLTSVNISINSAATTLNANINSSFFATTPAVSNPKLFIQSTPMGVSSTNARLLSMHGMNCDQVVLPAIQTADLSQAEANAAATNTQISHSGQIGVFSNCLKWVTSSTVKSIYSYFEVQQVMALIKGTNNLGFPYRIVRYIKLYPQPGVFQDTTAIFSNTGTGQALLDPSEKWATAHFQVTPNTASTYAAPYAVCLIEISARIVNSFKLTTSNTLIIWLFATSLLDTDINSAGSEYPVTVNGTAYGLNSGQTLSLNFRRIGDSQNLGAQTGANIGANYPNLTNQNGSGRTSYFNYSELEILFYKEVLGLIYLPAPTASTQFATVATNTNMATTLAQAYSPGFIQKGTMYHFFLGSAIFIQSTSNTITDQNALNNIYIPFYCPTAVDTSVFASPFTYPSNGVYFVDPIITVAWGQMSSYKEVSKLDSFVNPAAYTSTTPARSTIGTTLEINTLGTTDPYTSRYTNDIKGYQSADATASPKVYALPIQIPLWRSPRISGTTSSWANNYRGISSTAVNRGDVFYSYGKAYFQPYSSTVTGDDKLLTIWSSNTSAHSISALTIFLNNSFGALSTTVNGTFGTTSTSFSNLKLKSTTSSFYIMGKPFNKFLAHSQLWPVITTSPTEYPIIIGNYNRQLLPGAIANPIITGLANSNIFSFNTFIQISGIPRLPITVLNTTDTVNGTINPLDFLAFFTHLNSSTTDDSAAAGTVVFNDRNLLTNAILGTSSGASSTSTTFVGFVLWHPITNNNSWNASLAFDVQDGRVVSDKGGNLNLTGTLPSTIPTGAKISVTFTSSLLSSTTLCGLVENGITNIATNCVVTSPSISCQLTVPSASFNICCYGVTTSNSIMQATSGQIVLNNNTTLIPALFNSDSFNINLYSFPPGLASSGSTINLASLDATGRDLTDTTLTTSNYYAKLTDINYYLTNTNTGYGVAQLLVKLPRPAVRGMTLAILADFSKLKITNVNTKIIATFGNSQLFGHAPNQGDIFIESVYSNLDGNGISLKLKNMIYKCGLDLSDTLNLFLWPVAAFNYQSLTVSISMKNAIGQLSNAVSHSVTSQPTLNNDISNIAISTDFVSITNIFPNVAGEYATWTMTLNLSTYTSILDGIKPTELMVFFDHIVFGSGISTLLVYSGSTQLQTEWIYPSTLSVILGNSISFTSGTNVTLTFVGIYNPYLLVNNGVYMAVSLNLTDFYYQTRKTVIHGIFTINSGIFPSTNTVFGNIIFNNLEIANTITIPASSQTSSTNTTDGQAIFGQVNLAPRANPSLINSSYTTLHQFGFTIDIANNNIQNWTNGFTYNNPTLCVTFPMDYTFNYYTFSPTATIDAYFMSDTDNSLVTSVDGFVTVNTVTLSGNQICMTLSNLVLTKYFQYFVLSIYNAPVPSDTTVNTTNNRATTLPFSFLMMNGTNDYIFRSFTNLNNFSNQNIIINQITPLLPQNKGFLYNYSQFQWVPDVNDKSRQMINNIIVYTGMYSTYTIKIRSVSKYLQPAAARMTITSQIFKLQNTSYLVSSSLYSEVPFMIGVACLQIPGHYVIFPSLINGSTTNIYTAFMPFAPVMVYVDNSYQGKISFTTTNTVRINGSIFVDFKLSSPTFETQSINFLPSADSLIENSVVASGASSVRTVFRMTNPISTVVQTYQMGQTSTICFAFANQTISFIIDGIAAIIPNNAINPGMFQYFNADTDTTVPSNAVKFVFTTIYSQIYVFGALYCKNSVPPSDSDIMSRNITTSNELAYYAEIYNVQAGITNIVFSNLVRGTPLNLRIIISSTQGLIQNRTYSSLTISNYTMTNGTIINIMAKPTINPICVTYLFATRPGIQVTTPLLSYYQQQVASGGYYETGCVSIIDQYGTQIPGLPLIANMTVCGQPLYNFVNYTSYIVNQTSLNVTQSYTVCATSLPTCANDPTDLSTRINNVLNALPTNQTFLTVLNVEVVPQFQVSVNVQNSTVSSSANSTFISGTTVTPTITNVVYSSGTLSFNGVSSTQVFCTLKVIGNSDAVPTSNDFNSCTTNCLNVDINKNSASYNIPNINLGNSSTGKIYGVCSSNAILLSTRGGVTLIATFNTGVNTPATNTTNTNNGTKNTTGALKLMNLSLYAMILFMFLLLN